MKVTQTERIEILMMIGCGDRVRTQREVGNLVNAKYPNHELISQSTVSKIEEKFRKTGHIRDLPKSGRKSISEDKKVNILLEVQENPHTSTLVNNLHHSDIDRVLKKKKWHAYKVHLLQELLKDDFDRRI